jgi:hypothetical protein
VSMQTPVVVTCSIHNQSGIASLSRFGCILHQQGIVHVAVMQECCWHRNINAT